MYTVGPAPNLSVVGTKRSFDAINTLANASHQEETTYDEGPMSDIVLQEKVEQISSDKVGQPSINRAAQQAMFKARQLHAKLQDNPKEIIYLENDDCGQPHQKFSGSSQKCNSKLEITNILLNETS